MALDSARELYFPVYDFNSGTSTVQVTDLAGTVLRTITIPNFGRASGIAIDASDNKFLMDVSNGDILQLDSGDHYVGALKLNLPANQTFNAGGITRSSDGDLVLSISSLLPVGSTTPASYVKKIKLDGTELWSVPITSDYSRVLNVTVDTQGRIYVLRAQALEVWDSNANQIGRVDLTARVDNGVDLTGLSVSNDRVYVYVIGRVFVLSPT